MAPRCCFPSTLAAWLEPNGRAALVAVAWSFAAPMLGRALTALALLVRTPRDTYVLLSGAHLRLPRPSHPRGHTRASSQHAADSLLQKMYPAGPYPSGYVPLPADAIPFLACDMQATGENERGCRVVVCPLVMPTLPSRPWGLVWRSVRAVAMLADESLIAHARAAAGAFDVSGHQPPSATPAPPGCLEQAARLPGGMQGANVRLRAALVKGGAHAASWLDSVGAKDADALAATPAAMRTRGPDVSAHHLRRTLLTPRYEAPETDPYKYPVNEGWMGGVLPISVEDLFLPKSWQRALAWFKAHWPFLRACETEGVEATRGVVPTFVFTQDDIKPRFQGRVWDCRSGAPVPADFSAEIKSPWHRKPLGALLADYPDKELLSFVTRGTASKTESLGLAMVLGPHLQSLATAFGAVADTIDDSVTAGSCGVFDRSRSMFPFVPCYSIPQGAVDKSDGKHRRSSDYGFSRKETVPPSTPINVAARNNKWVKEVKPDNAQLANDVAVLRYAADLFEEDLFLFSEDFTSWFNQFGTHPSEWFKTCFLWLQRARADSEPIPVWVVEYVMGFGMMPSSGIAQRFSHALVWLLLRRFDASEGALLDAETDPVRVEYLQERAALGPHQRVLWTATCFTDDSVFGVVGADRSTRFLTSWGEVVEEIGVITKSIKRQAGCCVLWTGAFTNGYWANQIIPPEKILRAVPVLKDVVAMKPVTFTVYRKTMGLVVHLRMLLRSRRLTVYGMFQPYLAGILHPAKPIRTTQRLRDNAKALVEVLMTFAGCSCADPLRDRFDAAPFTLLDALRSLFAFTDAALQGAPVPGLGGWLHGYFFSFPLPPHMLGYPIPQLEFLAVILGLMVFRPIAGLCRCVNVTDSETTFNVVDHDGANNEQMQWLHVEYEKASVEVGAFDQLRHGFGETNPFADLASRGRLRELYALARQMGIAVTRLPIPLAFQSVLDRFVAEFGERHALPGALRQRERPDRQQSYELPPLQASSALL